MWWEEFPPSSSVLARMRERKEALSDAEKAKAEEGEDRLLLLGPNCEESVDKDLGSRCPVTLGGIEVIWER